MISDIDREARIAFYTGLFGADWVTRVKNHISALWSIESYKEKVQGLTARGFTNPQKMITSLPTILGYSFDNIDEKIQGLTARGFSDPQKMITSLPTILGYSFENIDRKIRHARRLGVDVYTYAAYTPVFCGMSVKNYVPIARYCRDHDIVASPSRVGTIYSKGLYRQYL